MAKLFFVTLAIFMFIAFLDTTTAGSGECPLSGQVHSCNPKCIQDTDCSYGKKCCQNLCNTKSCVEPKTLGTSSGKGSSSGGTGAYCNNVKCSAHEKCDLDRTTKRMKCVRA